MESIRGSCGVAHVDSYANDVVLWIRGAHLGKLMIKRKQFLIGKMLVPLGWYPSCSTPRIYRTYIILCKTVRCIWGWLLCRVPSQHYHHFPFEFRSKASTRLPAVIRNVTWISFSLLGFLLADDVFADSRGVCVVFPSTLCIFCANREKKLHTKVWTTGRTL